jgi:hypothetical protein
VSTVVIARAGAFVPTLPVGAVAFATPLGARLLGIGANRDNSMLLRCAGRPLARTVSGARAMAMAAGPNRKKTPPKPKAKAKEGAEGAEAEEISNRAKFRAIPIDPAVMKRIYDMRLTAPMGAAMRNAIRTDPDALEQEKQFKGFSRGPLYRDIPENVMEMIGTTRKDKLTFIAGALNIDSMPPPLLPEVAFCGRSNVGKSSLVNAVTLSNTVRSSDKPGMTQQVLE